MWLSRFLADLRAADVWSVFRQTFFVPRPTWSIDDIPDLTGKVVIVTGGNTGLGKESARVNSFIFRCHLLKAIVFRCQVLLIRNAKVYIGCRSKERADNAILELERITGKKALFLPLDLASLKSVKEAATLFMK
jgi:hypothetical protein